VGATGVPRGGWPRWRCWRCWSAARRFSSGLVNDDATYVPIAQKLNTGALLSRRVDNKPPLIYATFAWHSRLCGALGGGREAPDDRRHLGCAGLIFIGRNLLGRRVALGRVVLSRARSGTSRPHTEIYANLFVLGSLPR